MHGYPLNICLDSAHGVRKYEPEAGRFLSIDPLWENYFIWTPYQYCGNDPVNKVDVDGKEIKFTPTNSPKNENDEKTYDAAMDELVSTPTGRSIIFTLDVIYKDIPVTIKFVEKGSIPDIVDEKGKVKYITYGIATPIGYKNQNICSRVEILIEREAKMSYTDLFGHEFWHAIQGVSGFQNYMDTWELDLLLDYPDRTLEKEAYQYQNIIHNEIIKNSNSQQEEIK